MTPRNQTGYQAEVLNSEHGWQSAGDLRQTAEEAGKDMERLQKEFDLLEFRVYPVMR